MAEVKQEKPADDKQKPEAKPAAPAQQPAAQPQQPQGEVRMFAGFLAEIVAVERRKKTGIYGEIYSVSCKILEGRDRGRIIRRNMLGPSRIGDVVRLPDTNREAREIKVK